ncbi:MAG: sugar ABC transporter substrate-binding protein [Streptosporangiaceae bacterium]|nr:sugar ABC transporter substrate-binding protein [Streptosporangiaceae bacterium]
MNIRKGALATLVVGASVTVAACTSASSTNASGGGSSPSTSASGSASASAQSTSQSHITIGFANPQDTQPVLQSFQAALIAAAGRVGDKVIALNAGLSVNQQVSDIQTFITDKVNVIIVFPLAVPPLQSVLNQAHSAGIKLIGYNAVLPGASSAAPFDTDLDQGIIVNGAKDAASYVSGALKGKGNVLGINIGAPVPSLIAMVNNYKSDVTSGNPGIKWLETATDATDSLSGGQVAAQDAITRYHGNIQAVMSYTDEAAIGAYNALKAAGVKNTVIIGQQGNQDGINAIKAGQIQGDIDTQPWKEALYALKMAQDLIAGQSLPAIVEYPAVFITKDNLSSYVPWDQAVSQIKSGAMSLDVSLG